jgi:creatinine amidohydrolase
MDSPFIFQENTMLLEDLNWMDVEEYLKHDDRIILVTGSCEQHGYLSLLSDVRQPMAIATAAAERENVLVAPPLNFGVSSYFSAYPGTISLSVETHNRVVCELVSELHRQGFKRILVLNGHGGNFGMEAALRELINRLPGLRLMMYNWWKGPAAVQFYAENKLAPAHANWSENFPFTRVTDVPTGDKPATGVTIYMPADEARARLGDGSFGGPYQVSDETMQGLFEVAVDEVVQLLRGILDLRQNISTG